jgi:RNA polymerase sigma-70 factor (ECF subfamily)
MTVAWRTDAFHTIDGDDGHDVPLAWIEAARADRRAFAPLYQHFAPAILGYTQRRLGSADLADDATAQTFTRAIAAVDRFDPGKGSFRAWLFTIARNIVIDTRRRDRKHLSLDHEPTTHWLNARDALHTAERSPEAHAELRDDARRLAVALATLPERQREIVELRAAGLTGAEIARVLGISHGAVKSAQHRAYAALRDRLADPSETTS